MATAHSRWRDLILGRPMLHCSILVSNLYIRMPNLCRRLRETCDILFIGKMILRNRTAAD